MAFGCGLSLDGVPPNFSRAFCAYFASTCGTHNDEMVYTGLCGHFGRLFSDLGRSVTRCGSVASLHMNIYK